MSPVVCPQSGDAQGTWTIPRPTKNKLRDRCMWGHDLTDPASYTWRTDGAKRCKRCWNAYMRRYYVNHPR